MIPLYVLFKGNNTLPTPLTLAFKHAFTPDGNCAVNPLCDYMLNPANPARLLMARVLGLSQHTRV